MCAAKNAPSLRPNQLDQNLQSEPLLSFHQVSPAQSKGGLRELFSRNRSMRGLAPALGVDATSPNDDRHILSVGNMDTSWMTPPLYQIYSQSVKHINLEAPVLSAQSIIRINEQRSTSMVRDWEQNTLGIPTASNLTSRRPRRPSASISKAEWTRKVYVLTTSGNLLQYSGEGAFDRRPEKVLRLGKDSVAFASDAIEGRHYVLHVSQSCSDDGEPDLDSPKGIFSRIGIKTASARRSAKVILMVFDTPDDLDSWLTAIRTMIGTLGGGPYSPESFELQPGPQPDRSQRYLVQRNPYHCSHAACPAEPISVAAEGRPSTQSSTYTVTDLERLRDSRTSNMSLVTGTPTSFLDSPPPSVGGEECAPSEVPYLKLPDLGPPSLVDFSQQRRQSRLSLVFSNITRDRHVDIKPTAVFSRQASLRAQPDMAKNPSMPEMKQFHKQNREHRHEQGQRGSYEKVQEREKEPPIDPDTQQNERRVSTVAPLPTSLSLGNTAPEPLFLHRSSRLPPTTSEPPGQLPKRYSSLEHSRGLTPLHLPKITSSQPSLLPRDLRRPTSMQLRPEPLPSAQISLRSSNLGSYDQLDISSLDAAQKRGSIVPSPNKKSHGHTRLPFGPPVGPPPSCPLPAVPVADRPLRRQSLAAREIILAQSWGKQAPSVF